MTSQTCLRAAVLGAVMCLGCGSAHNPPAASGLESAEPSAQAGAKRPATVEEEHQRVKQRFADPRHQEMLGHACFSAVHTGGKAVEELVHALFVDMKTSGSFNFEASVSHAGGIEPYKARIASYLKSDDVMARGTAALALAIAGDLKYVDPLVSLLRNRDLQAHSDALEGYDRGMAMMALALLKATDYRAEIAAFQNSQIKNESEAAHAALELMDH